MYLAFFLIWLRERVLSLWHHDEWKQAQTTNLKLWVMVRRKVTSTFCQQGAGLNFSQKKESRGTAKWQEAPSQKSNKNWRITYIYSNQDEKLYLEACPAVMFIFNNFHAELKLKFLAWSLAWGKIARDWGTPVWTAMQIYRQGWYMVSWFKSVPQKLTFLSEKTLYGKGIIYNN